VQEKLLFGLLDQLLHVEQLEQQTSEARHSNLSALSAFLYKTGTTGSIC
jgi:hypothetical protein